MKDKGYKAADRWLTSQKNPRNKHLNAFIRRPKGWASKLAEDAHREQAAVCGDPWKLCYDGKLTEAREEPII